MRKACVFSLFLLTTVSIFWPCCREFARLNLLFLGDTNRVVAETPMNDVSTRSLPAVNEMLAATALPLAVAVVVQIPCVMGLSSMNGDGTLP